MTAPTDQEKYQISNMLWLSILRGMYAKMNVHKQHNGCPVPDTLFYSFKDNDSVVATEAEGIAHRHFHIFFDGVIQLYL